MIFVGKKQQFYIEKHFFLYFNNTLDFKIYYANESVLFLVKRM